MIMTMHDKTADDNSTLCHVCNEEQGQQVLNVNVAETVRDGAQILDRTPTEFDICKQMTSQRLTANTVLLQLI